MVRREQARARRERSVGEMSAEMAAAKALPTAASDQSAASAVCSGGVVRAQWLKMEEAQRMWR